MNKHTRFLFIIFIFLIFGLFIPYKTAFAQAVQIYPYNSASGPVYQYGSQYSTCDGGVHACYDMDLWRTDNMFDTESDGVQTYRRTGSGWNTGYQHDCCQGPDWNPFRDYTKNHPGENANWAEQSIKIPAGIGTISRVKFYEVGNVSDGTALTLVLLPAWDSPESAHIGSIITSAKTGGTVEFNPTDWVVTPGNTYYIRLRNPSGNLSLPILSPCGPTSGCTWWIDWGGVGPHSNETKTSHSTTDAYPDGRAYSGNWDGTNLNYGASHFDDLSGGGRADIARMAVWMIPPQRQFLCSSASISGGTLSPTQSVTITSVANTPVTRFMYAFYNLGNLYGSGNPKPIIFGGSEYVRIDTVPLPTNTHSIQVNFADINKPDENWGNQFPVNIQVNAYFYDSFGQLSYPELPCVVSFTIVRPPPANTISGPANGYVCRDLTYTANPSNATGSEMWAGKRDYSDWAPLPCTTAMGGTKWCRIGDVSVSPIGGLDSWSYSRTWNPPSGAVGDFYVATNAYGIPGKCTGNPYCTFGGVTCEGAVQSACLDCGASWLNCAANNADAASVHVNACNPASPTSLLPTGNQVCSNTPTTNLTLLWNADPAYSSVSNMWYDVRVSDGIAGQSAWGPGGRGNECGTSEDICINQWNTNSMNVTVTTGKTYSFWVHDSGQCCAPSVSTGTTFTVPACPPTITSLQVNELTSGQSGSFSCLPGYSGRNDSTGNKCYNPMKIVINASAYGGKTITRYYTGFYNQAGGLAADLNTIQGRIDSDPTSGFLLVYDTTHALCLADYCVRTGGMWVSVPFGWQRIPASGTLLYKVNPAVAGSYSWGIAFEPAFGSKSVYTAVQVDDNSSPVQSIFVPDCKTSNPLGSCKLVQ